MRIPSDFDRKTVLHLASRYTAEEPWYDETELMLLLPKAAERTYWSKAELRSLAKWKWRPGRAARLIDSLEEQEVREITNASFTATKMAGERLRIGALLCLRGVDFPIASAVLHFAFPTEYPILDVRAMTAVGGSTYYNFERWIEYCDICVAAAQNHNVTMRELDRALFIRGRDMARRTDTPHTFTLQSTDNVAT